MYPYADEFDELFTHLCWKYGLDALETSGYELDDHISDGERRLLMETFDRVYGF